MGKYTIKNNHEFARAYKRGKSFVSPVLVTYVFKNPRRETRYGITASKKIGGAVQRNRARRIIKEAYRLLSPGIREGYDLVFVARARTTRVRMDAVKKAMDRHLREASLILEPGNPE